MRTTINVDDQLLMQAKAQAAASGLTLAHGFQGDSLLR